MSTITPDSTSSERNSKHVNEPMVFSRREPIYKTEREITEEAAARDGNVKNKGTYKKGGEDKNKDESNMTLGAKLLAKLGRNKK